MIHTIIQKLLGRSDRKNAIVESKNQEADVVFEEMLREMQIVTRKVDRLNLVTSSKLVDISSDLQTITERIAIATGGKNRGLR